MAFNTVVTQSRVFADVAIRATTKTNSDAFLITQLDDIAVIVKNDLDQAVTIGTEVSFDEGTNWVVVGTTVSVAAGGSLVTNQYDSVLTGIKTLVGHIRLTATATVAPTTGTLAARIQATS